MKAALFGGSFDPPHVGHQEIIKKALQILDIDKLIVLPAYRNPFKKSAVVTPKERFKMCQEVFGDIERVVIDDFEIKDKVLYTIESLEHFQKFYDVAYIIIGADNVAELSRWKDFQKLNVAITWVIVKRGNIEFDTSLLNTFKILKIDTDISSTQIREELDDRFIDKKIQKKVEQLYKRN